MEGYADLLLNERVCGRVEGAGERVEGNGTLLFLFMKHLRHQWFKAVSGRRATTPVARREKQIHMNLVTNTMKVEAKDKSTRMGSNRDVGVT